MNKRFLFGGAVLAVISLAAAFTVWALQVPTEPSSQTPSQQAVSEQSIVPFKAILAEKLGVAVEELAAAMAAAREEFQAQLPERLQRPERMDQRPQREGRPGSRMQGQPFGEMGKGEGGSWMKKTTITHEYVQTGSGAMQQNFHKRGR